MPTGRSPSTETKRKISMALTGRVLPAQTRKKISKALKGRTRRPLSAEHRQKISAGQMGKKRGPCPEWVKKKISRAHRGKKLSAEHRQKISQIKKGTKLSVETKAKITASLAYLKGKPRSTAIRQKISLGHKKRWAGKRKSDLSPTKYFGGWEAAQWKSKVLKRDNYRCQRCSSKGPRLTAHHKKPWQTHPELRFAVSNGQTLCNRCHAATHRAKHQRYFAT
jgi:5-methylcytosine-specific restriction endonuclease McrA